MRRIVLAGVVCGVWLCPGVGAAQTPAAGVTLTLKDAEQMALRNHPRVLAGQNDVAASRAHVAAARSTYFPTLSGEVTGSAGNNGARIGAGALSASALFNRFGQGVVVSQLITDSGRTPNLVAGTRLESQASEQHLQATEYDVLLAVNLAFFDVLRTEALVKVATDTVKARQTLLDQVTALAAGGLRSQLDVNFAEVNVSDAKLLLLNTQNDLESGYAQLARAL
ncbi:MAG: TolC family protein, partial [Acidobacteriaceae bacterium]|nr:TolC family protein [Acidobacteriaceae bacterium]